MSTVPVKMGGSGGGGGRRIEVEDDNTKRPEKIFLTYIIWSLVKEVRQGEERKDSEGDER